MIRKKTERTAKPFAARVCTTGKHQHARIGCEEQFGSVDTYNDSVIPSEDGQFIKSGYEVPPSSDVTSEEDAKGEHRDRVHEATGSCP